uniref:NADH-ubiquinone oxidoreductase chain 2 n=1 Tax=Hemitheconyx caudicinctus TaxID=96741 RepID=J7G5W8_9SAUR|nr:NADH dehydrogenase subunit 2 [Hemitheconyx caudicinctus]
MLPLTWATLTAGLIIGTLLAMSSHHWLLAWVGLEMTTLSVIPLIYKSHHPRALEAAIKYFLTQACASILILFTSMMAAWNTGHWEILSQMHEPAALMMLLALSMKLGVAPTHFWFPEVLQGATIPTALLLTTWQKIAPISLLCLMHNSLSTKALLLLGMLSGLLGGIMGLNQTQTRKILAFSSIAHMGWLILALALNPNLTLMTMMIYLLMTAAIFLTLIATSTKTVTDLGLSWSNLPATHTLTMLAFLSLAGLPPFSGFLPKWMILEEMIMLNRKTTATIMILTSLPSLYFYLRLAYLSTMVLPPTPETTKKSWRQNPKISWSLSKLLIVTLLLLPLMPHIIAAFKAT